MYVFLEGRCSMACTEPYHTIGFRMDGLTRTGTLSGTDRSIYYFVRFLSHKIIAIHFLERPGFLRIRFSDKEVIEQGIAYSVVPYGIVTFTGATLAYHLIPIKNMTKTVVIISLYLNLLLHVYVYSLRNQGN